MSDNQKVTLGVIVWCIFFAALVGTLMYTSVP